MSLTIIPLLLLSYYKSLSQPPRHPPRTASPLAHARYALHRLYYQYMITFSGYMLDPAERFLFDVLLGVILYTLVWCSTLITPPLGRMVLYGLKGGVFDNAAAEKAVLGDVVVQGWAGNMTMRVTTGLGVVGGENCTAMGV